MELAAARERRAADAGTLEVKVEAGSRALWSDTDCGFARTSCTGQIRMELKNRTSEVGGFCRSLDAERAREPESVIGAQHRHTLLKTLGESIAKRDITKLGPG